MRKKTFYLFLAFLIISTCLDYKSIKYPYRNFIKSSDIEPNNDISKANVLLEGTTFGNVSETDAWDYYKIYLYVNDNISLVYTLLNPGWGFQNPGFYAHDPSNQTIETSFETTVTFLVYEVWEEGWWIFSIEWQSGEQKNYSLDCNVISVNDPPSTPSLLAIEPNPDHDGNVYLNWIPSDYAEFYYVFRSTSEIVGSPNLVPIGQVISTTYLDTHLSDNLYYYAIIGSRNGINSSLSNNQQVDVQLGTPHPDYSIIEYQYAGFVENGNYYETYEALNYPMNLPFEFPFYDQNFSKLYISLNGWLSFNNSLPTQTAGAPFPTDEIAYNYSIAPFLSPNADMANYVRVYNGSNYWAFYWETCQNQYGVYNFFSVVLFRTGEILFEYSDVEKDFEDYLIGINYGDGVTGKSIENADPHWIEKSFLFLPPFERDPLPVTLHSPTNDPDYDGIIDLSWSSLLLDSETYYLYRSDSEIIDVEGLTPIYGGPATNYQDIILADDQYFYTVLAQNGTLNSTLSNVINVTVTLQNPNPPNVHAFDPSTTNNGYIHLTWDMESDTTGYYIFRNTSYISSIIGLNPIIYVTGNSYEEYIFDNADYFYVVIGSNAWGNSSLSNCVFIVVNILAPEPPNMVDFIFNYSHTGLIKVQWESVANAFYYLLFRDTQLIESVDQLIPILNTTGTNFNDTISLNGQYFYAVIAANYKLNSSISENINITVLFLDDYLISDQISYAWVDTSLGKTLNLGDDLYSQEILPFDFPFYDRTFNSVYISANGWISFVNNQPSQWENPQFPLISTAYGYAIAAFWDDLVVGYNVTVKSFENCWIITWANVSRYDYPQHHYLGSFQILLFSTGEIKMQFQNIDYTDGGYTTGLNLEDGELGLMYGLISNTTENLAIIYGTDLTKKPSQPAIMTYPSSPTHLSSINLKWEPSALAENYSLYRTTIEIQSLEDLAEFTPIYTGDKLEFTDVVETSNTYYYTLIAENVYGKSEVVDCLLIEIHITMPSAPTITSVTVNNVTKRIIITWNPVEYAEKYTIFMDLVYITGVNPYAISFETTQTTYSIQYYVNDTYYLAVMASNIHGNSPLSECWSVNTSTTPLPVNETNLPPVLSHPNDININISELPFNISWTIQDDRVLTSEYQIYIDGILNKTATWQNNTPVIFEIINFKAGVYNFTIQVSDGVNPLVWDTIIVTLSEGTTTTDTDTGTTQPNGNNLGVIIGISGGVVLVLGVGAVIVLKKKGILKGKR